MEHPNLENIIENSIIFVKDNFTYKKTVERYSEILSNIQ